MKPLDVSSLHTRQLIKMIHGSIKLKEKSMELHGNVPETFTTMAKNITSDDPKHKYSYLA